MRLHNAYVTLTRQQSNKIRLLVLYIKLPLGSGSNSAHVCSHIRPSIALQAEHCLTSWLSHWLLLAARHEICLQTYVQTS
jgi:hypothetical protein